MHSLYIRERVCHHQRETSELQLHITIKYCNGSSAVEREDKRKCQTQTKVDRPARKAKTSATDWILWKNAWQRYLKETELGGHAAVTQLWECLSEETALGLINAGFGERRISPS